ncbi:NAD(P)H-binding protein [Arthrobacter tumbae]|uniref:NAD(P)H-binding protein n=1 Tax=Arthrobacter tumbae TaxID=163874 RepID=UPI00195D2AEB|nr:NAD(P)H-binding protein [Arthrobacter tumbae]MBM7782327.1 uncharacterized protein YbjT (DUF2867 family) [Arthrobacter tumbae]
MRVFVIGVTGAIGKLLAAKLSAHGDEVTGLVREPEQQRWTESELGIRAVIGDLSTLTVDELSDAFAGHDVIVYSAGSNGGSRDVTAAIDGDGVERAAEAARLANVRRFVLVSVLPESWRERNLEDDVEFYFTVKKRAEVSLTRSGLEWVILRPSLLTDEPGLGSVSMGPAELHDEISRDDVAATLNEIVHEPRIRRQILELNSGDTAIPEAVLNNVRV